MKEHAPYHKYCPHWKSNEQNYRFLHNCLLNSTGKVYLRQISLCQQIPTQSPELWAHSRAAEQLTNICSCRLTWKRHRKGINSSSSRERERVAQTFIIWRACYSRPNHPFIGTLIWMMADISEPQSDSCMGKNSCGDAQRGQKATNKNRHQPGLSLMEQHLPGNWFPILGKYIWNGSKYDRYWHLIPLTGYEHNDFSTYDLSIFSYLNNMVKIMVDLGLFNIGHYFQIDRSHPKTIE